MQRRFIGLLMILFIGLASGIARADDPPSRTALTPDNVTQLVQVGQIGRGLPITSAIRPDNQQIAVGTSLGVWLFPVENGIVGNNPRFLDVGADVGAVIYHPTNQHIITVSAATLRLDEWDTVTGDLVHTWYTYPSMIGPSRLEFLPDERVFVRANRAEMVWDYATRTPLDTIEPDTVEGTGTSNLPVNQGRSNRYVPAGSIVVGPYIVGGFMHNFPSIAVRSDGATVAVVEDSSSPSEIQIWGIENNILIHAFYLPHDIMTEAGPNVYLNPGGHYSLQNDVDGLYHSFDMETGELVSNFSASSMNGWLVAHHPNGKHIVTTIHNNQTADAPLALFDMSAQRRRFIYRGCEATDEQAAAFSPDGAYLYMLNDAGGLCQWNAFGVMANTVLEGDPACVANNNRLVVGREGRYVVSMTLRRGNAAVNDICVWDVVERTFARHSSNSALSISVAIGGADDSLLAIGGASKVELWDVQTLSLLHTLDIDADAPIQVAFLPDGARLITTTTDGVLSIWGIPE